MANKNGSFSLSGMEDTAGLINVRSAAATLGEIDDDDQGSALTYALGELNQYAEQIPHAALDEALGAVQMYHAAFGNRSIGNVAQGAYTRAAANLARLHAVVNEGVRLQVQAVDRPNVFMVFHFNATAPGPLRVDNAKCSPPGMPTTTTLAIQFVQARAYLLESTVAGATSRYAAAVLDIQVQQIGFAQYDPLFPTGGTALAGMPLEAWAPSSYQAGVKPMQVRGLTYANVNTQITAVATFTSPTRFAWVVEFRMAAVFGENCGAELPSLVRGPTGLAQYRHTMASSLYGAARR